MMRWLKILTPFRKLFPPPLVHIPTVKEVQEDEDRLARHIMQQHAGGNVFLATGRVEMLIDLFDEEDHPCDG